MTAPSLSTLLMGLLLAACTTAPSRVEPVRLTVLHTNDHHGRFWRNAGGELGLAARKTLVDRVRAEVAAAGGHLLLLDGGDVNTGVPESDLQHAEPDFRGMSRLGYDAMAVGNHEFDRTLAVLERQRAQWSNFPWLSANVYVNDRRVFEPYRTFERGGARIAVLGLTTDDTAKYVRDARFPGYAFKPPIDEARALVPALRGHADMVIALTHMGHYTDGRHGSNAPGDVELARAVPGIDLVVGGHSQNVVCMLQENVRNEAYEPQGPCAPDRQNGAWIVQAGEWGKFVGRADFEIAVGRVRLMRYQLLPVNLRRPAAAPGAERPTFGEAWPEDPDMLALLGPYRERGAQGLAVPVGRARAAFDGNRATVRHRQAPLGRLIGASMLARTGADVAVVNGGSIRDSLPAGPLTYRDILTVMPFSNQVVLVTLQGGELARYLQAVQDKAPGSGGYAQLAGRPPEQLAPAQTYRLALNSFIARGGDGYPDLSGHPGFVNTGYNDADVLREFIAARGEVAPEEFDGAP